MPNGSHFSPDNKGEPMATKRHVQQERKWTSEEMQLGNSLIEQSETYSGGFIEKFGAVAKARGYKLYTDMPKSIRMYIQFELKRREDADLLLQEALSSKKTPEEQWYDEVDPRTLHPEDEAHIIEALNQRGGRK